MNEPGRVRPFRALDDLREDAQRQILRLYFGFPANPPRLSMLRPPGGNSRPNGIQTSFFERRQRRELAEFY